MSAFSAGLDAIAAIDAFLRARIRAKALRSRADIDAYQSRRLARWIARHVSAVPKYEGLRARELGDLPVIDKFVLMGDFAGFNRLGLDATEGWRLFRSGQAPAGHHIGASTGTSGNRGLYLISARERARWLGTMLAKTLPRFPLEGARVAVILPQNAALYRQPGRGSRLAIRFFDLHEGVALLPSRLAEFRPDTLVAPPKVLRLLAESGSLTGARRLFSGGEVLDPDDRHVIEAASGLQLGEIYMATEGLLATSCVAGRLHLAEDVMHFELEPGPSGSGLVNPVISDFSRETQIMARYRMNDLLRLFPGTCPCGSPYRAVEAVVGRNDDMLDLPSRIAGQRVFVTPDVVRNTILNAWPALNEFQCDQVGETELAVRLPVGAGPDCRAAVHAALDRLFAGQGAMSTLTLHETVFSVGAEKRRRVRCSWKGRST